ncbi:MAG: hypothetical protein OXF99_05870 [bacterium]|nr:hypothetical protein [bacterium]
MAGAVHQRPLNRQRELEEAGGSSTIGRGHRASKAAKMAATSASVARGVMATMLIALF